MRMRDDLDELAGLGSADVLPNDIEGSINNLEDKGSIAASDLRDECVGVVVDECDITGTDPDRTHHKPVGCAVHLRKIRHIIAENGESGALLIGVAVEGPSGSRDHLHGDGLAFHHAFGLYTVNGEDHTAAAARNTGLKREVLGDYKVNREPDLIVGHLEPVQSVRVVRPYIHPFHGEIALLVINPGNIFAFIRERNIVTLLRVERQGDLITVEGGVGIGAVDCCVKGTVGGGHLVDDIAAGVEHGHLDTAVRHREGIVRDRNIRAAVGADNLDVTNRITGLRGGDNIHGLAGVGPGGILGVVHHRIGAAVGRAGNGNLIVSAGRGRGCRGCRSGTCGRCCGGNGCGRSRSAGKQNSLTDVDLVHVVAAVQAVDELTLGLIIDAVLVGDGGHGLTGLNHMANNGAGRTRGGRRRDQKNLTSMDLVRVGQGVDALDHRSIVIIVAPKLVADLVQRIAGLDRIGREIKRGTSARNPTDAIAGGGQGGPADGRGGYGRRGGRNRTGNGVGSRELQLLTNGQLCQLVFIGKAVELHNRVFAVIVIQSVLFADLHQNLAGLDLVGDEVIR